MSLTVRAVIAIALALLFYGMALGLAGGLLGLAWLDVQSSRVHPKLILICVAGGAVILWSVLPRIDRFEAPGIRLEADQQPRLFALLRRVAAKAGQPMPSEVYLVGDINAFVTERGGWMGIGSRRVMGLGLPLLGALSEAQLSAVVGHELGHFVGGDTKLGPWIYKTRAAMARAVDNLASMESLLTYPFVWYSKLFLRITQAISRAQEYAADRVAAQVAGVGPATAALARVEEVAGLHDVFMRMEVAPVVGAGRVAPLDAGFRSFLGSRLAAEVQRLQAEHDEPHSVDPLDSHPPMKDRIEALAKLGPADAEDPGAPRASALLSNLEPLEHQLIAFLTGRSDLQPVGWSEVGESVYRKQWEAAVTARSAALSPTRLAELRALRARAEELGRAAGQEEGRALRAGLDVLVAAVGLALLTRGYAMEALPGEPIVLVRDEDRLELHARIQGLESDEAEEKWRRWVSEQGLSDLVVGPA